MFRENWESVLAERDLLRQELIEKVEEMKVIICGKVSEFTWNTRQSNIFLENAYINQKPNTSKNNLFVSFSISWSAHCSFSAVSIVTLLSVRKLETTLKIAERRADFYPQGTSCFGQNEQGQYAAAHGVRHAEDGVRTVHFHTEHCNAGGEWIEKNWRKRNEWIAVWRQNAGDQDSAQLDSDPELQSQTGCKQIQEEVEGCSQFAGQGE